MSGPYKFGLIGHNIAYSRSADIFNAIFEIKKMKGSFENFDLEPDQFEKEFKSLLKRPYSGLSVTIPYKSRVIPMLYEITPIGRSLDAVNSISFQDGKTHGHNTDITGFALPLKPYANQLKKGQALILGSGGSAKAAIYSLHADFEINQFTILGRSAENLNKLKKSMEEILLNSKIQTATLTGFMFDSPAKFAIVVNCTPLGGWNHPGESPLPQGFRWPMTILYYDLNYNSDNRIVTDAARNNVPSRDGSQMLVGQAVRSFEIWTGETVSFDNVYERVFGNDKSANN